MCVCTFCLKKNFSKESKRWTTRRVLVDFDNLVDFERGSERFVLNFNRVQSRKGLRINFRQSFHRLDSVYRQTTSRALAINSKLLINGSFTLHALNFSSLNSKAFREGHSSERRWTSSIRIFGGRHCARKLCTDRESQIAIHSDTLISDCIQQSFRHDSESEFLMIRQRSSCKSKKLSKRFMIANYD